MNGPVRLLATRLRGTSPVTIVGALVGAAAVLWMSARGLSAAYFVPKAEAEAEIGTLRTRNGTLATRLDDTIRVERGLRDIAARTLGGDKESVDHRLRTRLNRIVEAVGLSDANVGTGRAAAKGSPARAEFRGRTRRDLRDEIDFVELEGFASGTGTLEQVLRLADAIVAEPWTKRIDSVRFDPDRNGDQFAVTIRLSTMFLPGRAPEVVPWGPDDPGSVEAHAALLAVSPFHLPSPEVVTAAVEAPVEAPPPASAPRFPWGQWALTGVAESSAGPEAWMRNRSSGETRILAVGDRLDAAQLVGVEIDAVHFELEGRRFRIAIGDTMRDRLPLP